MPYDQLYEGLRDGRCDVAEGFSTDGRISAWGFQNLINSKRGLGNCEVIRQIELIYRHILDFRLVGTGVI